MSNVYMKVTARHIGQIGRELVTDYVTALTELVKNSYDADAEAVHIVYENVNTNSGKIKLIDTGSGISREDIEKKWTVIGTNNKVRSSHSLKYNRRYSGKKGIGRFAVERLAEHCTLYSFTQNDCFKYHINWNAFEGINVVDFKQRLALLEHDNNDLSTAKYIRSAIEYLYYCEVIKEEDKQVIKDIFGSERLAVEQISTPIYMEQIAKFILPIMNKYKNIEEMATEIKTEITEMTDQEREEKIELLKNIYLRNNVNREFTGLIIELDELRDNWKEKDINKVNQEMQMLIAPSMIDDIKFKVSIEATEFDISSYELTNEITDMKFADVTANYIEKENKVRITYKETGKEFEEAEELFELNTACGNFSIKLLYFVRSSDYLKSNNLRTVKAREILDAFCGVKIYRDGFRVRPYGESGNDWLMLDSNKIKDTHGYLIGNNQIIGVVNLSQEENPLLVDATNREAIIENEAFSNMKMVVQRTVAFIQNKRYEEFEKKKKDKELELETLKENEEIIKNNAEKEIKQILDNSNTDEKTAKYLAIKLAEERKRYYENQEKIKRNLEEQLFNKQRELELYKNLASLGILSGTFGHETSDVLARVSNDVGYMQDIIRISGNYSQIAECSKRLDIDLRRVGSYSKLLLAFLKKKNREKKEFIAIKSTIIMLAELYENITKAFDIEIDLNDIEDILSPIKMYQIDLESIFINLISNSFEAIKNKHKRVIKISLISDSNDHILLVFEDSGCGIPLEKRDWVLLPFNTSKEEIGVGLGMTIVNDIVNRYNYTLHIADSKDLGGVKIIINMGVKIQND